MVTCSAILTCIGYVEQLNKVLKVGGNFDLQTP